LYTHRYHTQAVSGYFPFSTSTTDTKDRSTLASFQNTRALYAYQFNSEKGPVSLTKEEAPEQINKFVLTCLNADKNKRYESADRMLFAWDAALDQAKASALEIAEVSEANRFWKDNFGSTGDVQGVEVPSFVKLFCEKFSISEAAGKRLALAADEDGNGILTREEFLEIFSKYAMKELAAKYEAEAEEERSKAEAQPGVEPGNSYHRKGKRLVFTDVRYQSKGTLTSMSKERIGTLTMEHGKVEARRFESSQSILVYEFRIQDSILGNRKLTSATVEIAPDQFKKSRTFTFQSADECNQFVEAFDATKTWISG
jgi:hypothetical protein